MKNISNMVKPTKKNIFDLIDGETTFTTKK